MLPENARFLEAISKLVIAGYSNVSCQDTLELVRGKRVVLDSRFCRIGIIFLVFSRDNLARIMSVTERLVKGMFESDNSPMRSRA
jgi:hypothetical protein